MIRYIGYGSAMGVARVERLFENGLILSSNLGKECRAILSYWRPSRSTVGDDEAVILRRGNSDAGSHRSG